MAGAQYRLEFQCNSGDLFGCVICIKYCRARMKWRLNREATVHKKIGMLNSMQKVCGFSPLKVLTRALAILVALLCPSFNGGRFYGQASPQVQPNARHIIVISVDGMGAQFYISPSSNLHIPHLLRMKSEGSFAEAVEGVYPTVTDRKSV